ncbi:TPA: hypothetical protein ACGIK9_002877 [Acinetobacter baumannii]|uniref:hypothetical protein n=1 Tax=Acinetobacter baumannii TaxID=470 RepID=UPI00338DEFB3
MIYTYFSGDIFQYGLKMEKIHTNNYLFVLSATDNIKKYLDAKVIAELIWGPDVQITKNQIQQIRNRLNPKRSNPTSDFLGFCVSHSQDLQNMTLGEFFGLTHSNIHNPNLQATDD